MFLPLYSCQLSNLISLFDLYLPEHPWIVNNCSSSSPSRLKYGEDSTLRRRTSLSITAQVKAAMAAAAEAEGSPQSSPNFNPSVVINSNNSAKNLARRRRYSMGVDRKGNVVVVPTISAAPGGSGIHLEEVEEEEEEEYEEGALKNVLFRSPTPFRPQISDSDIDEEEEDDFSSEDETSSTSTSQLGEIEVAALEKKLISGLRMSSNNHGDLIQRSNSSSSSDEFQIPVAQPIQSGEVNSRWLPRMKGKVPSVMRASQKNKKQLKASS